MLTNFLNWWDKHRKITEGVSAFLFILQIFHLIWLTVVATIPLLIGGDVVHPDGLFHDVVALFDWTEIPAIIGVSITYIARMRRNFQWKTVIMMLLLHSQWLHILWITDEFVIESMSLGVATLPLWLVWVAILIDYLELPVMYDTLKNYTKFMKRDSGKEVLSVEEISIN